MGSSSPKVLTDGGGGFGTLEVVGLGNEGEVIDGLILLYYICGVELSAKG